MGDDTIRNFGAVIAICGAIALFGGTTFAVWTFNVESKSDFGDGEFEYKFGVTEVMRTGRVATLRGSLVEGGEDGLYDGLEQDLPHFYKPTEGDSGSV